MGRIVLRTVVSLPQGLRIDPQSTPTLIDWGKGEKPAKETGKRQLRGRKVARKVWCPGTQVRRLS